MTTAPTGNSRAEALDAYLAQRKLDGYEIETRTALQAFIVRRHRLHLLLRLARVGTRQRRLVISVNEDCEVTTVGAEPSGGEPSKRRGAFLTSVSVMGHVRWIVETAEHRVLATGYQHPAAGEPEPGMLIESLPDGPWRVVFVDALDLSDEASNVLTVEAIDDHLS